MDQAIPSRSTVSSFNRSTLRARSGTETDPATARSGNAAVPARRRELQWPDRPQNASRLAAPAPGVRLSIETRTGLAGPLSPQAAPAGSRAPMQNQLLAGLPEDELARIRPRLSRIEFAPRQFVCATGDRITAVLFPEAGWLSHIITLRDGDGSEVGLTGREGMVGVPLLLGDDRSMSDIMAHAACSALRMDAAAFRVIIDDCPALRSRLMRYALVMHAQAQQIAACNAHHLVEQRFARSLLVAHDRAGRGTFMMTHEQLSIMLGVRRAGVTVAAGALQRAGLIRYSKGMIAVSDRTGLEAASCECYAMMRAVRARALCEAVEPPMHDRDQRCAHGNAIKRTG